MADAFSAALKDLSATADRVLTQIRPDLDRMFALTTRGSTPFASISFRPGDVFVFGSETKGLDPALRDSFPASQRIRLPMRPDNRSLNLSNAVAVVVFEAWRQNGFAGGN